ncbi:MULTISPECIES: hypothetical protein [unclassified Lysinibacillus]|uniref:hypothetical protein n=1 Tax=unclassified Lysinibacillus TaxID=2636778 RepID=UPI00201226F6|nr:MULTISPECIES: hypothetical protein [unclassified Lysinibacillus]MCL1698496.1 hypothetical protein [Lysinibacillus sp. BPa_S21]MCL1703194.1 hypothetical protein [Lysinibacillus sp. Bpr_S20]
MAFVIALLIVLVGVIAGFQLTTEGRSEKGNYIVWGIITMIAFAPFLSFVIGVMYGIVVKNSWATSAMMYLSPLIFIIGLIILLLGIYKNDGGYK